MELKDYIKYYIGQKCWTPAGVNGYIGTIKGINETHVDTEHYYIKIEDVKPILRKLDSLQEDEMVHCIELGDLHPRTYKPHEFIVGWKACDPKVTHYLLQHSFDLFGLIDSNLAIDAATIANQK